MLPRVAFAAVSAVHVAAQATGRGRSPVGRVSKALLMPTLAGVLASGTTPPRDRLVRLTGLALGASWVGDVAPQFVPEKYDFPAMMGGFLVAQGSYCVAFWPYRDESVVGSPALAAYVVPAAGLATWLGQSAGPLQGPVAAYVASLTSMAALSTGLGPIAAAGGMLFMASDALIGLRDLRGMQVPGHGVWVMGTYALAQALLVAGVRRRSMHR